MRWSFASLVLCHHSCWVGIGPWLMVSAKKLWIMMWNIFLVLGIWTAKHSAWKLSCSVQLIQFELPHQSLGTSTTRGSKILRNAAVHFLGSASQWYPPIFPPDQNVHVCSRDTKRTRQSTSWCECMRDRTWKRANPRDCLYIISFLYFQVPFSQKIQT